MGEGDAARAPEALEDGDPPPPAPPKLGLEEAEVEGVEPPTSWGVRVPASAAEGEAWNGDGEVDVVSEARAVAVGEGAAALVADPAPAAPALEVEGEPDSDPPARDSVDRAVEVGSAGEVVAEGQGEGVPLGAPEAVEAEEGVPRGVWEATGGEGEGTREGVGAPEAVPPAPQLPRIYLPMAYSWLL